MNVDGRSNRQAGNRKIVDLNEESDGSEYEAMDDGDSEIEEDSILIAESQNRTQVKDSQDYEASPIATTSTSTNHNDMEAIREQHQLQFRDQFLHAEGSPIGHYYDDHVLAVEHDGNEIIVQGEPSTSQRIDENGLITEQPPSMGQDIVVVGPVCVVCGRNESVKIRLFRWPKNPELRLQWLQFFRLEREAIETPPGAYICCFHFSADTFIMVENRIFWKASALPKYRLRRPCLSEPFPWEPAAQFKQQQQVENPAPASQPPPIAEYKIRYRTPYNRHKNRQSHDVAVLSPATQPHLYYEFHYNRATKNNTKFYACLSCRKAKTESGIRDVIRTIHLDGVKLLSKGDPFAGHHFACRPHNIYDYRSTVWAASSAQSASALAFDEQQEVVYVDERGDPIEWADAQCNPDDRRVMSSLQYGTQAQRIEQLQEVEVEHAVMEIQDTQMLEHGDDVHTMKDKVSTSVINNSALNDVISLPQSVLENEIHSDYYDHVNEIATNEIVVSSPQTHEGPPILQRVQPRTNRRIAGPRGQIPPCHLCSKKSFASTEQFVRHLQWHIQQEPYCGNCSVRINVDEHPVLRRRKLCNACFPGFTNTGHQ